MGLKMFFFSGISLKNCHLRWKTIRLTWINHPNLRVPYVQTNPHVSDLDEKFYTPGITGKNP